MENLTNSPFSYENIVAQKTSDYTLWLPIQVDLITKKELNTSKFQLALLGADDCADIDGIKNFCYRIGFLFQSQVIANRSYRLSKNYGCTFSADCIPNAAINSKTLGVI